MTMPPGLQKPEQAPGTSQPGHRSDRQSVALHEAAPVLSQHAQTGPCSGRPAHTASLLKAEDANVSVRRSECVGANIVFPSPQALLPL